MRQEWVGFLFLLPCFLGFWISFDFLRLFRTFPRRLVSSSGVSYRIAGLDVLHFRMQSSFVRDYHVHKLVKILFCFRFYLLFL